MACTATGVLIPVIVKLATLLQKQYRFRKSVRNKILFLKDELTSMDALLLKLTNMDGNLDPQLKVWRDQVRELSYDIEDTIDCYMHQVNVVSNSQEIMKRKLQKIIQKEARMFQVRKKMTDKILQLKARVDDVSARRRRYDFDAAVSSSSGVLEIDPRLPALYAEAESLVGIEEPRDELVKWLTEGDGIPDQKLKVVSIVGLGGLGKTTLARQVSDKIGDQFDCQAFVPVSQKPDIRKIFINLITCITGMDYKGIEAWDHMKLIDTLRGFLNDKRYFIIIDDIWNESPWETIKCAFPNNGRGSRILTTTRKVCVAQICCSSDDDKVCEMKPLSDFNAEKLFFKRIFSPEDKCPSQLKAVSIDILRKCRGLPLAIITMASLLASNKPCTKEKWERYRDFIGTDTEAYQNMQNILSLSYNELPPYLKTCLLHLSTFPEDFLIWRDSLVRRWIAEGFVTPKDGQSFHEMGECYFNDLLNRSMIQPVEIQYDGKAYACRVHDMILDLIVLKSAEENFIVSYGQGYSQETQEKQVRRLSIDCRDQDITVPSNIDLSSTRSLITYGSSKNTPLLSRFHLLRAIAIEGNAMLENHYLNDIERLFQLKYLRLSEVRRISELPEQIWKLQQLEVLELRRTEIKKLPNSIVRLKRLVTLVADDIILPEGIENMEALQRLCGVKVNSSTTPKSLRELGSLTKLNTLGIIWSISDTHSDQKIYADSFVSCIDQLCTCKLRYLHVGCFSDGASLDFLLGSWPNPPYPLYQFMMTTYYCFPRIPEWMASLSDITFLSINIVTATKEIIEILGALPSLLSITLFVQNIDSKRLIFSSSGFQLLKEFYFHSWHEEVVGPLMFEVGALPKLEKFRVNLRAQMTVPLRSDFYQGLQNLVCLKHLLLVVDCRWSTAQQVEATEAVARKVITVNQLPNHVHVEYKRNCVNRMVGEGSNPKAMPHDEIEEDIHFN
ncbi:unnamed protein product [Urochloa humidicola]